LHPKKLPQQISFILAILLTSITACTGSPDCSRAEIHCAAFVTDTRGLDDNGINQDTWAGLETSKSNGLIDQIAYIESVDTRDYLKNITYFADNSYDVIVTSGVGLRDETAQAADLYPDSVFIGINQADDEPRPNLVTITFAEDQMGFTAGVLAARLSETRVVGAVCETSGLPAMWRYCEGFRAGAIYEDEDIKVLVTYREGDSEFLFIDEKWGYETGNKLIFRGADVLFAAGGLTGQGALRAAAEAGIPAIGVERDQAEAMAESGRSVAASFLGQTGLEVQKVIRLLGSGNVTGGQITQFGFTSSERYVPESLKNELNELIFKLWSGEIHTSVPDEKH